MQFYTVPAMLAVALCATAKIYGALPADFTQGFVFAATLICSVFCMHVKAERWQILCGLVALHTIHHLGSLPFDVGYEHLLADYNHSRIQVMAASLLIAVLSVYGKWHVGCTNYIPGIRSSSTVLSHSSIGRGARVTQNSGGSVLISPRRSRPGTADSD